MKPDLSEAVAAARSLLGMKLVHRTPEGITSGYIVETEAYNGQDPASHTFRGKRIANAPMFEAAGTIYVYFTYGMHYCFNIVTGPVGHGEAVLIRALEPIDGIELMKTRRGLEDTLVLCSGPAKLVQAMGITKSQSGSRLEASGLSLEAGFEPDEIVQTSRIGISKAIDQQWRFYVKDNPFVSVKPKAQAA